VFPVAPASALFSDALTYRFRLRPLTARATEGVPAFGPGPDEYRFDLTFDASAGRDGGPPVQSGTCITPSADRISFRVGEAFVVESDGLRLFAGPRLDPFFIDLGGVLATEQEQRLAFRPTAANSLDGTKVLSIVVEFDVAALLGREAGPVFGVVGETLARGGGGHIRLERMGRAEIKNVILRPKTFDTVNRDLEIRDLYNDEDAFDVGTDYTGAYRARLNANLAFLDRLDGTIDWPPDDQGDHPLTDLLLADFLVVDTSKPFSPVPAATSSQGDDWAVTAWSDAAYGLDHVIPHGTLCVSVPCSVPRPPEAAPIIAQQWQFAARHRNGHWLHGPHSRASPSVSTLMSSGVTLVRIPTEHS
jgi:Domain of unknown function (DUF4331)